MLRLSSNATLFLKLFIPIFWTTIMLALTLVVWLAPEHYFGGVPLTSLRYGLLFLLLMGVGTFWLALWPLKRVETDGENVYVSNYFRTAHYNWQRDVESINEARFFFLKICTLELNGVGSFGRKMRFVAAKQLLQRFKESHAGVVNFRS